MLRTTTALLLLTLLLPLRLLAQGGTIVGSVENTDGERLPGATVRVEGSDRGAVADSEGSFEITGLKGGRWVLSARFVGYEEGRDTVTVIDGRTSPVTFRLAPQRRTTRVEVTAERRRQSQSDTRASVTKIEPREAKYLPGAGEDVMRSLRSLPGVLAPNDFTAQLVVRGSGPDQNLIVIDDMEVFNPYRLYGFVSMFNPETISDITLLSGGFPAKYGDRLSAVLDVINRDGEPRDGWIDGKINASISNVNAVVEGKMPGGINGSWLVSARRTYYDLILGPLARSWKLVDGDVAFPNFRDLQVKGSIALSPEHALSATAITSRDGTELVSAADREQIDSISITDRSTNNLAGLTWRFTPTDGIVSATTASWYRNEGETEFGGEGGSRLLYGDVSRDSLRMMIRALPQVVQDSLRARGIDPDNPPALGISDGRAGFGFTRQSLSNETSIELPGNLVELGAGIDLIATDVIFTIKRDTLLQALSRAAGRRSVPDSVVSTVDHYRWHAYAQDRVAIGDRLWVQPGLRFDYYKIIDRSYLSPRVGLSWAIDDLTTMRAAYGHYYQSPGYEKLFDRQTFFDLTSPEIANLRAEKAIHYVLGLDRQLDDEWQVRLEGYYKSFDDLIVQQKVAGLSYRTELVAGGDPRYPSGWTRPVAVADDSLTSVPVNGATGEAYGAEILLQKVATSGDSPLGGWIGYSLAWANRYREGVTYPFNFDQRHTVNVVLNYRVNDWLELGANFQYGSGFPYTPPTGFSPIIVTNPDSTGERQPAIATNIFGETLIRIERGGVETINSARLPAYHRLDLRGTFHADWWGLDWSLYLDIVNVYNHKNILSRSYSFDRSTSALKMREVSMLPFLPTLGMSVRF